MSFIAGDIFGGGSSPNYAAIAEQQEKQREASITTGTADINNAFAGFTPQFYQNYANAYTANQEPQLAQQYAQTKNAIGFDLANRGLSRSGTANTQWDNLATTMGQAQTNLASSAKGAAQNLQQQVQNSENTELSNLYQSADPAEANASAISTAASFSAPSVFPALANQFSSLLNTYYTNNLINTFGQTNDTIQQLLAGQQNSQGGF